MLRTSLRLACAWALLIGASTGCRAQDTPNPSEQEVRVVSQPLNAFCTATVVYPSEDREVLAAAEDDYLPRVIACENGNADFQALKAQAVAARSYLYYRMSRTNNIEDGQQDQVYTCNRPPSERHYQAAAETAGEVLLNPDGDVIAAFYVAGAIPSTSDCVPAPGDRDPTTTERFVTYNWGNSGAQVTPSPLGHPASPFNRGCQSQNGAHCLSLTSWDYKDILRFYYGMDIDIAIAEGACVDAHRCPAISPSSPSIVSEQSACFTRSCTIGDSWYTDDLNGLDGMTYTFTIDTPQPQCWGRWSLRLSQSGRYLVEAYLTDIGPMSQQAPYLIHHASGEDTVRLSQEGQSGWVAVAVVDLTDASEQWVELADNTGEPYTGFSGTRLAFDALRITPTDAPLTNFNPTHPDPDPSSDTTSTPDSDPSSDTASTPDSDPSSDALSAADTTSADAGGEDTNPSSDALSVSDANDDDTDPTTPPLRAATPTDDCACQSTRAQPSRSPSHAPALLSALLSALLLALFSLRITRPRA